MIFGGDVYILYDQVRDEELHQGIWLKCTYSRDTYLHVQDACEQFGIVSLQSYMCRFMDDNVLCSMIPIQLYCFPDYHVKFY